MLLYMCEMFVLKLEEEKLFITNKKSSSSMVVLITPPKKSNKNQKQVNIQKDFDTTYN